MSVNEEISAAIEQYWEQRYRDSVASRRFADEALRLSAGCEDPYLCYWARFIVIINEANKVPDAKQLDPLREIMGFFKDRENNEGYWAAIAQYATVLTAIGRTEEALSWINSIPPLPEVMDMRIKYMVQNAAVMVLSDTGNTWGGLSSGYSALDSARIMKDPARIALSLANLASNHLNYGNYEEAERCSREVLELAKTHGLKNRLKLAPVNLALTLIAQERYSEASELIREWIVQYETVPLDPWIFFGRLVAVFLCAQHPEALAEGAEKLARLEAELAALKEQGRLEAYKPHWLYYAWAKGKLLHAMGKRSEALEALHEADDVYERCLSNYVKVAVKLEEYTVLREQGNIGNALDVYEEYTRRLSRMLQDSNLDKLHTLAVKHSLETERIKRQQAELAVAQKSEFLARMSHEIRTPLNAVLGLAYLALQTNLDEVQRDYLTKINASGNILLGVINDILDFSKIEAGKLVVEHEAFDFEEVLSAVSAVVMPKASEKDIEVIFNIGNDVPQSCLGDALRLEQVLINLMGNSVKFTNEGGEIELSIQVAERFAETVVTRFSVRDTGIGMPQEQQAKLFEPFVQADTSTTRLYGGTGLGLSISMRLVELMGSRIACKSEKGRGSEFYFELPLACAQCDIEKKVRHPNLSGLRILVVDDNPVACGVLASMLAPYSERISTVYSPVKALEQLRTAQVDIVLTDWKMPEMDGIQLIQNIHKLRMPHMPKMVLVTAYGCEEACRDLIGLDGILHKPVSMSTLHNTITGLFPEGFIVDNIDASYLTKESTTAEKTNYRVLLVDDNDLNRQIGVDLFAKAGIKADTAVNGKDAIEKIRIAEQDRWAAVFMDLEMPVMDGHEACMEIRKDKRFDNIPIIALTAHAVSEVREQCRGEGMQDFLSKPIHPERLFSIIDTWIKHRAPGISNLDMCKAKAVSDSEQGAAASKKTITSSVFNVIAGLEYMYKNKELYASVLERFCEAHTRDIEDIRDLLRKGEAKNAEIKAHTLKSLSASIGGELVSEKAETLEHGIREGGQDFDALIQDLEAELERLVSEISEYLRSCQHDAVHENEKASLVELNDDAVIARFLSLAEIMSGETAKYLREYEAVFQKIWGKEKLQRVSKLLAGYDFDNVLREASAS